MQELEAKTSLPPKPSVEEAAKANIRVDVEEVRRAQELMEELRKAGVVPQGYEITSPYERRSLNVWRDLLAPVARDKG